MYRAVLCVAAVLLTAGIAAPPTAADDRQTLFVPPATADDREICHFFLYGDKALDACSRLIRRNPRDVHAYIDRAKVYGWVKGDRDNALADYDAAIRFDPGNAAALFERGKFYALKDYDRAITDFDQAIRLDPGNAAIWLERSDANYQKKDYDRAIADCDEVIRLDPKNADAFMKRAWAYERKHDYDRAVADFGQMIRLHPSTFAYEKRGDAYYAKHDYDHAFSDYDQMISIKPDYGLSYLHRGGKYEAKGEFDRAIVDYDRAIRLDSKQSFSYEARGRAYFAKGDYDRAIANYDQAIRLHLQDGKSWDLHYAATAYARRGSVYSSKRDYDRAIADLDEAIRLSPDEARAYSDRGFAYANNGDFGRAMADLDRAIELEPKYPENFSNRAAVDVLRGDPDQGIADADEAIRLLAAERDSYSPGPEFGLPGFAYNWRGRAWFDKGEYDRAIADYDEALRRNPFYAEARQNRDRALVARAARQNSTTPQAALPLARPDRRVALVIGMGAYANVAPLRNPVADARAVAEAFRRLGFTEVVEREDLTRAALEKALKDFGDKAATADWAVIYFAGHGVEIRGANYIVPVDAELARADHVEEETVSLTRVLSKAEPARRIRMVILDACRNDPFRLASADGRPRNTGRGLSPVEPVGGVLVAYAARGGTTAADGGAEHSPFTEALLTHLETPGVDIGIMFRKVRDSVLVRTNNVQEPFVYGSLPGQEFYFREAGR
jgi:tetratricopeptide (TPR) repeat protein